MGEDAMSRRRRTFYRCSLWGGGMIASVAVFGLLSCAVARSPLFVVKRISIERESSGRPSPEAIRAVSGIRPGMNLILLDADRICRRLEAHPWIEHASVVKRLPDEVLIQVRQTRPAAVAEIRGRLYYMDGRGRILDEIRPGEPLDFPMITGLQQDVKDVRRWGKGRAVQQALSLLHVLEATPALGSVSEIHIDRAEGLRFVLEGFSSPVRAGWSGFERKIIRFSKVLPALALQSNAIESVDLRFSDQIVVRQRDEGKPRVPRGTRIATPAGSVPTSHPTT